MCCLAVMPEVPHANGGTGGLFSGMTVAVSDRFPTTARDTITTEIIKHGGTQRRDLIPTLSTPIIQVA